MAMLTRRQRTTASQAVLLGAGRWGTVASPLVGPDQDEVSMRDDAVAGQ
jgi:hypothetical protein